MKGKINLVGYLISMIIFLLFGEVLIRSYDYWNSTNLHKNTSVNDAELGWKSKANYTVNNQIKGSEDVRYSTTNHGFKSYLKAGTSNPNVLFIGDSFTQSVEVNNEDTYYEKLNQKINFDLFAYGMSGYGTLQEKMIIDKFKNSINPKLVILQFCTNDFVDNCYELNKECNYKVNAIRPYKNTDNKLIYENPYTAFERLIKWSKFLNFVNNQITKIGQKYWEIESGEGKIARLKEEYSPFKQSIEITKRLLLAIKEELPSDTELLVFCADGYEPQLSVIKKICQKVNINYHEDHIHQLRKSLADGKNPYSADGVHWNVIGHEIVANSLQGKIQKMLVE